MLSNYLRVLLLQGGAVLAAIINLWLISRYVQSAVFGQYCLYLTLIQSASMFLVGWPNAALLRFGREEWNERQRIGETLAARGVLYLAGIGGGVVLAILGSSWIYRFLSVEAGIMPLILLGLVIFPMAEIFIYANQATGRSLPYGYVPLLSRATFMVGLLLIPLAGIRAGMDFLVSLFLLGGFLAAGLAALYLPRIAWGGFYPSQVMLRRIWQYSWSIPLGAIAAFTVQWVDTWVIRVYQNVESVGIYSWAYQITALGTLAFSALNVILTPAMIDAHLSGDVERKNRYINKSLRLMLLFGVGCTLVLPLIYPVMLKLVKGNYLLSYWSLVILFSGFPFQLMSFLVYSLLAPLKELVPKLTLVSSIMAVANVVGDLLLVAVVGIAGAAVATWMAFSLAALLQFSLVRKYVPGIITPPLSHFVLTGLLVPTGVVCLRLAGELWGGLMCVCLGVVALLTARRRGAFSLADVEWLEAQGINRYLKVSLVSLASWLAASRNVRGHLFKS